MDPMTSPEPSLPSSLEARLSLQALLELLQLHRGGPHGLPQWQPDDRGFGLTREDVLQTCFEGLELVWPLLASAFEALQPRIKNQRQAVGVAQAL